MNKANFVVLPELKDFLPALTPEEQKGLEDSLMKDDLLSPLVVCEIQGYDDYILLDGHHRHEIAVKHGLAFHVDPDKEPLQFESVDDAKLWMFKHQFGRRNLTPAQRDLIIGEHYNIQKKQHGGARTKSRRQNDELKSTAEKIAKEYGVSPSTVERNGRKAKLLEDTGLRPAVQKGEVRRCNFTDIKEYYQYMKENPLVKKDLAKEVIDEAKQNNGRITASKKRKTKLEAEEKQEEPAPVADKPEEMQLSVACLFTIRSKGVDQGQLQELLENRNNWKLVSKTGTQLEITDVQSVTVDPVTT